MLRSFDVKSKPAGMVDLKRMVAKKPAAAAIQPPAKDYTFNKFAKKKQSGRSPLLGFLIVLLFILAGAAIAGFFFFNRNFSGHSLKLTLKGPKVAVAGREIKFELTYENLDRVALTNMELVGEYPQGFYVNTASVSAKNPESSVWDLPDLPAQTSQTIILSGQQFAQADTDQNFKFILRYRPANFSSDFKETIEKSVRLTDSDYPYNVIAPEKINDGELAEWKISIENKSQEDLQNLYVQVSPGDGFVVAGTTPSTTDIQWFIEKLAAGEKKDFVVSGNYADNSGTTHHWQANWRQETMVNDQKQIKYLMKQDGDLEVVKPEASLELKLQDESVLPAWGKNVDFVLTYKNTGKIPLEKALIKLQLNSLVDLAAYKPADNIKVENGVLYWLPNDKNGFLSRIESNTTGEIKVSLPIIAKPEDVSSLSPEEMILTAKAELSEKFNDADKVFTSNEYTFSFSAEASLKTEAKYYLDAKTAVGSGPVPPAIGKTTTYKIYWKIYSGSKGLKDIKVKATLPSYITWQAGADKPTFGSELVFNDKNKEVVWEIPELTAYAQGLASFDVIVKPTEAQVNQLLILSNTTSLAATEKESGTIVSKTAGLLTSDLIGDPVAQGKGRVIVGK